jgi:soluble lytic murein transglycosylase-like protein
MSLDRRRFLVGAALALVAGPLLARPRATLLREVPPAYRGAALDARVPPRLLYAIALQESAMAFGPQVLPWPWTLNIQGTPHRYPSGTDAVGALTRTVTVKRIRNVDCGPMQVNWGYHADKLGSFERALEPRNNLAVGAAILAGHYRECGDWFIATGRYHNPVDPVRSRTYARRVFARLASLTDPA